VIALGGTDKSFSLNRQGVDDSCKYFKSERPILNSTQIASSYLDGKNGQITKDMFAGLETHFLQKLWTVQDHYPTLLFNGADGALVTVSLGEYIPETDISVVAYFQVCIPQNGRATICSKAWHEYRLSDERRIETIGDSPFVQQYVLNDVGKQMLGGRHLNDYNFYLQNHQRVGSATSDQGKDAAVDLLQSSEILSEPVGNHTIGGPIHVVLLDKQHPNAHSFSN
jgi:hypothetical protein